MKIIPTHIVKAVEDAERTWANVPSITLRHRFDVLGTLLLKAQGNQADYISAEREGIQNILRRRQQEAIVHA